MSNMLKKIKKNIKPDYVEFICPICKTREKIPFYIVDELDRNDKGNQDYPPRFDCENCSGMMEPVYYKNYKGKVYAYKN